MLKSEMGNALTLNLSGFLNPASIGVCVAKRIGQIIGTVCVFLVLGFSAQTVFCQDTGKIKLAGFDYPPFFSKESNGIHGIGADLGNELFRRLHFETELAMFPLKRALNYIKDGAVDGIMILVKSSGREQYLIYSEPLVTAVGYIWSLADRDGGPVNFERFEDLRPYRIGVTVGYSYGDPMDEFLRSMDTDSAPKEILSFKKLLLRRIDIVPATSIIINGMIKTHPEFRGKFVHSKKPLHVSEYFMGVSKKSRLARMIPRINRVITEMRAEGFIDEVVKKYTE